MKRTVTLLPVLIWVVFSCRQNTPVKTEEKPNNLKEWKKPKVAGYQLIATKLWLQDSTLGAKQLEIALAVNRTDKSHFKKMDTVLVPKDPSGDIVYYLPFPLYVSYLKDVEKIVFFSYPTQTFAAYEYGELVRTGQTNMGSRRHQTPTGLFFTNWKAKKTISTVNDEWELKWNFNIANKAGVGWHQYTLPGYPASHSCLRLTENDAKYLYNWADQWVVENKTKILKKGTPVIVFGAYDFDGPKPWLKLIDDPHALDISEKELQQITQPFLNEILEEQKRE